MNLETFKARARRKLQLPYSRNFAAPESPEGPEAPETSDATRAPVTNPAPEQQHKTEPPTNASNPSAANSDKFAAALSMARDGASETPSKSGASRGNDVPSNTANDPLDTGASEPRSNSLQAFTGSPAASPDPAPIRATDTDNASEWDKPATAPLSTNAPLTTNPLTTKDVTGDADFEHLRSMLLGKGYESQQGQAELVHHRTQASINSLRHDMDARLNNLTDYVEQLERSFLNSLDVQKNAQSSMLGGLGEDARERLAQTDARFDTQMAGMDARVTGLLDKLRGDIEVQREKDRAFLQQELQNVNARTDQLLAGFSERLDNSLTQIQSRFTDQLNRSPNDLMAVTSEASSGLTSGGPEPTVSSVRAQLIGLIDERITKFNNEQSTGLSQLRDTLLANTNAIKSELRSQTDEQRGTLATHRKELETQFNEAIATLNTSKVSHQELSQLLSRLADRVQQL